MTNPGDPWREEALRTAILAGDQRAWEALYNAEFGSLARYLLWRCVGLGEFADEIVQETWLTAVRRIANFDPQRASFRNWLIGIAANLLKNAVRTRQRLRKREKSLAVVGDVEGRLLALGTDGETIAVIFSELPDRYEEVLRAKYLEGRSTAEIAEETGTTIKTIESLLARAREAFRTAYARRAEIER